MPLFLYKIDTKPITKLLPWPCLPTILTLTMLLEVRGMEKSPCCFFKMRHDILREFRTEWLFTQMERWINRNNHNWMRRLDKACPGLIPADRHLVMLLYLGFSSTSIAFLSGRPSKQAVHTARCRLRQRLSSANHESLPDILQFLGLQ